jgi:hypothetical protein
VFKRVGLRCPACGQSLYAGSEYYQDDDANCLAPPMGDGCGRRFSRSDLISKQIRREAAEEK